MRAAQFHSREVGQGLIYIVAANPPGAPRRSPYDEAAESYQAIAQVLANSGAEVVQEKLFGLLQAKEEVSRARRDALGKVVDELPLTYIEGAPVHDGGLAGMQILAAKAGGAPKTRVSTLRFEGKPVGRLLHRFDIDYFYLSGISSPTRQKSVSSGGPELDAREMFELANHILLEHGIPYTEVVRTWIYLSDMLSWYQDFNRVRNLAYEQFGFKPSSFPASTGIEGRNSSGSSCIMDVLAVHGSQNGYPHITAVSNPRQSEAYAYGSAFSRGMVVEEADVISLYVSGCASVDEQGKTVHIGDEHKQMKRTLLNLKTLLAEGKLVPEDIRQATVFFKPGTNPRTLEEVQDALGYPALPAVYVQADVCRPDLLFEVDATAVRSKIAPQA